MVTLLSMALGFAASSEGPFWASVIEAGKGQVGAAGGIVNGVGNVGGLLEFIPGKSPSEAFSAASVLGGVFCTF